MDDFINNQEQFDLFEITKSTLFGIDIAYLNEIFGQPFVREGLNVIPLYIEEDYSLKSHLSYGLVAGSFFNESRQKSIKDFPSISTLLQISDTYEGLHQNGLSENYKLTGEAVKKYLLFQNLISPERWEKIINENLSYFNFQDVDTTGLKKTGKFKWIGSTKDSSVISDLFKWYESQKDLVEEMGFDYIDFKFKKEIPSKFVLEKIHNQFRKMSLYLNYCNDLEYFDFDDPTNILEKGPNGGILSDFSLIKELKSTINIILKFDQFIFFHFKPLFEFSSYSEKLIPKKHKVYKKIHQKVIDTLSEKGQIIHFNLIGNYKDYTLDSPIKFFYNLLHYGERNHQSYDPYEAVVLDYLIEFLNFLDDNEIEQRDILDYISTMKEIINLELNN